eukprot:TRINITY_DN9820_c0_g1_i4.p1 TRINITY_DN9820_c0_g1~~TRINITY_DN9820_c0_g1_i4.p1  ORF type:complete len:800 (-),score=118.08 TRINITY_DN9820_c0_g1_i4:65-2464(-)
MGFRVVLYISLLMAITTSVSSTCLGSDDAYMRGSATASFRTGDGAYNGVSTFWLQDGSLWVYACNSVTNQCQGPQIAIANIGELLRAQFNAGFVNPLGLKARTLNGGTIVIGIPCHTNVQLLYAFIYCTDPVCFSGSQQSSRTLFYNEYQQNPIPYQDNPTGLATNFPGNFYWDMQVVNGLPQFLSVTNNNFNSLTWVTCNREDCKAYGTRPIDTWLGTQIGSFAFAPSGSNDIDIYVYRSIPEQTCSNRNFAVDVIRGTDAPPTRLLVAQYLNTACNATEPYVRPIQGISVSGGTQTIYRDANGASSLATCSTTSCTATLLDGKNMWLGTTGAHKFMLLDGNVTNHQILRICVNDNCSTFKQGLISTDGSVYSIAGTTVLGNYEYITVMKDCRLTTGGPASPSLHFLNVTGYANNWPNPETPLVTCNSCPGASVLYPPLTTGALTTQPLTTRELTTSPLTTSLLTTSPLTTSQLTTSPLTTNEITTQPLTTSPLTTQPLTTSPLTTEEMTTSPLTTNEMTSGELTTSQLTTGAITTGELETNINTGTSEAATGIEPPTATGAVTTGTSGIIDGQRVDITVRLNADLADFNRSIFISGVCDVVGAGSCVEDDVNIKEVWAGSVYVRFELINSLANYANDFISANPAAVGGYSVMSITYDTIVSTGAPDSDSPSDSDGDSGLNRNAIILIAVLVPVGAILLFVIIVVVARRSRRPVRDEEVSMGTYEMKKSKKESPSSDSNQTAPTHQPNNNMAPSSRSRSSTSTSASSSSSGSSSGSDSTSDSDTTSSASSSASSRSSK